MDSFFNLATSRRSTRRYSDRGILREDLELCAEAARHAPSACNSQPWKFIIVDEASLVRSVSDAVSSGLYSMNSFAAGAKAFFVVTSERCKARSWLGGKIRNTDFRRMDIGMACQNLLLQAQELGIGSCVLGWFNEKKVKKLLLIPKTKKIELVIALGYPLDRDYPEKHFKPYEDTISLNKY